MVARTEHPWRNNQLWQSAVYIGIPSLFLMHRPGTLAHVSGILAVVAIILVTIGFIRWLGETYYVNVTLPKRGRTYSFVQIARASDPRRIVTNELIAALKTEGVTDIFAALRCNERLVDNYLQDEVTRHFLATAPPTDAIPTGPLLAAARATARAIEFEYGLSTLLGSRQE